MSHNPTIQAILQHEATKVVGIVVVTFAVIKAVILPLSEIQLNLAQVQKDILEIKQYNTRIVELEKLTGVMANQLNQIVNKQ